VVIIGVYILGEAFSFSQFIGMLLLIFGAILVAAKGFRRDTFNFDKYSIELMILSVMLGIGLATEKACLSFMSKSSYMIVGWGIQMLATLFFARKELKHIKHIDSKGTRELIELGTARSGHVIGYFLSVAFSGRAAFMASITSIRIPLVFIASFILLGERQNYLRKLIGVAVATAGIILM
jgi:uncharacterized membrane protein